MDDTPTAEQLLADAAWLKRLVVTLAGNEIDADDLVQESWLAAWRRKVDPTRPLRPWLSKVVRDLAGMKRRSDHRRTSREAEAAGDEQCGPQDTRTPSRRWPMKHGPEL
ncbi:MAG TPA: sigma factor [Kofleriaceae bacterium]|nr:sigma factor [Kofleriaceae bacterium]